MEKSIPFTAAEISHTWTSYMNSSANICVFSYFIEKVEDDELRPVIQDTLDMVKRHLTQTKELLEKANYPIPLAFTDKDVNTTAPKLFTDGYMVQHVIQLCMLGMGASTVGLSNAAREDVHSSLPLIAITIRSTTMQLKSLWRKEYMSVRHSFPFPIK